MRIGRGVGLENLINYHEANFEMKCARPRRSIFGLCNPTLWFHLRGSARKKAEKDPRAHLAKSDCCEFNLLHLLSEVRD